MCDGDAGGGFDSIPPDPSVLLSDTVATDFTTWLRSFPLAVGMLMVAGVIFLGALIFFSVVSPQDAGRQPAWIALAFATTSLVISWMWLRPWLFDRRWRARAHSSGDTQSGNQGE